MRETVATVDRCTLEETAKALRMPVCDDQNPRMLAHVYRDRIAPDAPASAATAAFFVDECTRNLARVAIPRAEIQLVVRFGASARQGLDVHALGLRQSVYRKTVAGGQRILFARLDVGACAAVLGVPAAAIAGRNVPLEDLWGQAGTQRLIDQLAAAPDTTAAAAVMQAAIAERSAGARQSSAHAQLALHAIARLEDTDVQAVARELGMSERHLRRVFRDTVGMSPKAFARLQRFRQALSAARASPEARWTSIAAIVGYYDQAHLIADFRAIAGTSPRRFIAELNGQMA